MATAAPQDQWRLLDVQAHDTRLAQIAHRQHTLPELVEIETLTARLRAAGDDLVAARTVAGDVRRELSKAEADVDQVRRRSDRDRSRLESGAGSAKDMQALQSELESLARRQSVLEDAELEVMERLEEAEAREAEAQRRQEELTTRLAELEQRRDAALAALEDEAAGERRARDDAAAGLPADLLALYERVRASSGGVGAARLFQRRCEGCRLELTPTDLARLRGAPDDAVLRCEECGRILVRTPDSGL